MNTKIEHNSEKVRTVYVDDNPRLTYTEYRCFGCGLWVHNDEAIWVDPETGMTTWRKGKPYHVDCAP